MASGLPQGFSRSQFWGLVAILVGALLGAGLGAGYGESMWLASGAAPQRIDRLQQTIQQKERFARAAQAEGRPAEAQRLRDQVSVLRREIERIEAACQQAQQDGLEPARTIGALTRLVGNLFLRLLLLVVLPLVFTSMVCGVASLGSVRRMGRLGGLTLFYYMATCAAAVLLGMLLVQRIQPGISADDTFAYVPMWTSSFSSSANSACSPPSHAATAACSNAQPANPCQHAPARDRIFSWRFLLSALKGGRAPPTGPSEPPFSFSTTRGTSSYPAPSQLSCPDIGDP